MASGFHQALCLTQNGPTLNINLAFGCFYLPINFVEFSCKYLRKDIRRQINQTEVDGIRRLFKNLPSIYLNILFFKTKSFFFFL
jgi:hypothetical protein